TPRQPGWRPFRTVQRRASSPPRSCPGWASTQVPPVHNPQGLGDHLDLNAVRVLEIDRGRNPAIWTQIRDAVCLETPLESLEVVRVGRDGNVLDTANALNPGLQPQTGKIEER